MKTLDYLLEVSNVIAIIMANRDTRVQIALTERKVHGNKVQVKMAVKVPWQMQLLQQN